MKKTITIPLEQYECLRGHLKQAMEIFQSLGVQFGSETPPKKTPKEKRQQKVNDYVSKIGAGQRGKKPDFLKK